MATGTNTAERVVKAWKSKDNPWMRAGEGYDSGLQDLNRGTYNVAISDMVLHMNMMERRKAITGGGYLYRVLPALIDVTPSDTPRDDQPVRNPTLHLPKLPEITLPEPKPVEVLQTQPVRYGTVAKTPPEIRRGEPDTMRVNHHKVPPPPPNDIMREAIAKSLKSKDLVYEIPPDVKPVVVPPGVSGIKPKTDWTEEQVDTVIAAMDAIAEDVAVNPHVVDEVKPDEGVALAETMIAAEPTIGSALDALLAVAKPRLLDFLVDIITHPRVVNAYRPTLEEQDAIPVQPAVQCAPEPVEKVSHQPDHEPQSTADPKPVQPKVGVAAVPKHNPQPEVATALDTRQKIAVVGVPLQSQVKLLEERYKDKFDILAIQSDTNPKVAKQRCLGRRVLLMTQCAPHRLQHSLQASGIKFEKFSFNVGRLKEHLDGMEP